MLPYITAHPVQGSDPQFAVLDEADNPIDLLVFDAEQDTVRDTAHAVAAQSY